MDDAFHHGRAAETGNEVFEDVRIDGPVGGVRAAFEAVDECLQEFLLEIAARMDGDDLVQLAFVLGATGLLDGKRATTRWKIASELAARHPKAPVEPDAIHVRDGTTYTSAGVTAGMFREELGTTPARYVESIRISMPTAL